MNDKTFIVLMDQIIKKKEVLKMTKIQEKHSLNPTELRASDYIVHIRLVILLECLKL